MRIVLTGMSGSGKTTILNSLLDKALSKKLAFPLPIVLYSQTRNIYQRHNVYTEQQALQLPLEQLKQIQLEIFYDRVERENSFANFISDRCITEYFAWTLLRCNSVLTQAEIVDLSAIAGEQRAKYTHVLQVQPPPNYQLPQDDEYKLRSFGQEIVVAALQEYFFGQVFKPSVYVQYSPLATRAEIVEKYLTEQWQKLQNTQE